VQARVVPEVSAGGGWASDLFPGAGFGAHGETVIAPGLGADLSTGPVVKLLSRYRYTLSRYLRDGDDAGSQGHDAGLTARLRLGGGVDLDVPLAAGFLSLDDTAPVEEDLPAGVALRWIEGGPLLRVRAWEAGRLEAGALFRASELRFDRDDASWRPEREWSAFAGASHRFGTRVESALRFEHAAVDSGLGGHDRSSDDLLLAVAVAPWHDLVVRGSLSLEHVLYPAFAVADDAGARTSRRREDLRRALGISLSHPLGEHVEAEASLAWTTTASNLRFASGERLSTWLGLRAELPYWL
jgi:hypothetical protein